MRIKRPYYILFFLTLVIMLTLIDFIKIFSYKTITKLGDGLYSQQVQVYYELVKGADIIKWSQLDGALEYVFNEYDCSGFRPINRIGMLDGYASDIFMVTSDGINIENQQIKYVFDSSGGRLRLMAVTDKEKGSEIKLDSVYFHEGSHKSMFSLIDVRSETIKKSNLSEGLQKLILTYESEKLSKRMELRLYDNSSALAVDSYYKLRTDSTDKVDDRRLFTAHFQGSHHKYKVVSFLDRTDENNTLVEERSWLGDQGETFQGNLIFVDDLETGTSFFVLKESPYNNSQINYPGFDFEVGDDRLSVAGVGFEEADLSTDKWTRSYSVVFANYQGEFDGLQKLRRYQKCIRNPIQARGEMIMMNTWGDRNKDANIGEEFAKKEILACEKLGVTHFQLDDGWQEGLSKNSASSSGQKWEFWEQSDWEPNKQRFPRGFQVVVDFAKKHGVTLGLWFAPSSYHHYQRWEQDAQVLIGLYNSYGIKHFKIDGISIPTKEAEENLRQFFSKVLEETNNEVFFNLDATAGIRGGYHFLYEYGGNIFLENRYASWGNRYYPYRTLRNLWMLSNYVAPEQLQIEFLNKWRNQDKNGADDPLAPQNIPFDYQLAIAMVAQPLAWFEGSDLPEQGFEIAGQLGIYKQVREAFHSGTILPIGNEPNGRSWTGFHSVINDTEGYFFIFREYNDQSKCLIQTYLSPGLKLKLDPVFEAGETLYEEVGNIGTVAFSIDDRHGYKLYRYQVIEDTVEK